MILKEFCIEFGIQTTRETDKFCVSIKDDELPFEETKELSSILLLDIPEHEWIYKKVVMIRPIILHWNKEDSYGKEAKILICVE